MSTGWALVAWAATVTVSLYVGIAFGFNLRPDSDRSDVEQRPVTGPTPLFDREQADVDAEFQVIIRDVS